MNLLIYYAGQAVIAAVMYGAVGLLGRALWQGEKRKDR